jgi:glycosyltransferase involved in cell wall biosynthesis
LSAPFLSIIIPAYNEEERLPAALQDLVSFLEQQSYEAEVLVVENGSRDRTYEVAREFSEKTPLVTVLHEEQSGKGRAVKTGMLAAHGQYRMFCDVDFSMPIPEINRFIPPALNGVDVAIGSREAPGAVRYNEPFYRHLTGRAFNTLVRWLALPGLQDTQCGFKCFTSEVVEDVFPHQTMTGWSFDAEVLYIALRRGFKVTEIPIPWYFNADSRVRLLQDSWNMATDLLSIQRNAQKGLYD